MIYWHDEHPFSTEHPIKLSRVVWLRTILRRHVYDSRARPRNEFAPPVKYTEYTTLFDLLKWGSSE
jgi:hypothetical protein